MVTSWHRLIVLGCASLLAPPTAPATPSNLNALLQNSPFGSAIGAPGDKSGTPLEFRGVMAEGDTYYFSIFARADSRSEWLQLDEKSAKNYVVKSYDSSRQELTMEYQGQSLILALTAAGGAVAPRSSPVNSLQSTASSPTIAQSTTPVNNAVRLSKIAQEIKRRRALRQKAISGK